MAVTLPPLAPGTVLSGRYKLEARLGAGATAAVWQARDLDLGRVVAVKALLGDHVDPNLAGRFEREGRVLGRLSHPNVVHVFCTGNDGGRPYLVMALVEGRGLHEVLRDGPLPVEDAVRIAADVADGLAAAHRAGVVHRDVKPANIIRGTDGVPRLVDFGIARAEDLTTMTKADVVLGTAAYLSPEQARGDAVGPASDVYALGCVLHELLTGEPPFTGDSPLAVAYMHVHQPAPPLPPAVPASVAAVVARCLAKDPADRHADGAELAADLRRVLDGDGDATVAVAAVPAAPVSPPTMELPTLTPAGERIDRSPLAPAPARRRTWPLYAGAAVAAFLLVLLLASAFGDDGGAPADADSTTTSSTTAAPPTTTTTAAPAVVAAGDGEDGEKGEKGEDDKDDEDAPGRGRGKGRGGGED